MFLFVVLYNHEPEVLLCRSQAEGVYNSKLGVTILGKLFLSLILFSFSVAPSLYRQTAKSPYRQKTHLKVKIVSGDSVAVEDEVVVTSSIVLPNKTLNISVQDEIIL